MERKNFDEKSLIGGIMIGNKELITSRQNPTVKGICALSEKKARRAERLFRFDGIKLFGEAVSRGVDLKYVVLREDIGADIEAAVESAVKDGRLSERAIIRVSESVFDKISEERSPEGIIGVAAYLEGLHRTLSVNDAAELTVGGNERILVAESIRDPGNLGTVIRSCAALGIDRLIISDDCADLYSPKVIRAAMGGIFGLRIDVVPVGALPRAIEALRRSGRMAYATALHSEACRIGETELRAGDFFVIGNEGHGLCGEVIKACDRCAVIPMTEGSESLNAAAAAAICIWETVRR